MVGPMRKMAGKSSLWVRLSVAAKCPQERKKTASQVKTFWRINCGFGLLVEPG